MRPIKVEVVATPGCHTCGLFDEFWHSIEKDWPNVSYQKIELTTDEGRSLVGKYNIMASPGIIINGELWAVGGFDKEKFIEKLKTIS